MSEDLNDVRRMETAEGLLIGADFAWGDPPQPVIVLALPAGVRVSASLRETLDRVFAAGVREMKRSGLRTSGTGKGE